MRLVFYYINSESHEFTRGCESFILALFSHPHFYYIYKQVNKARINEQFNSIF